MLTSLEPLSLKLNIDVRHIGGKRTNETIDVVGYISKSAHGEGRSSSDRQFFYVNSRPCVQPRVLGVIDSLMLDCKDIQRDLSILQ
jgi:DNA mismatch repair protein PMS2